MQLPTTLLIVATSLISGVLSLPADTSGSADAAAPNTTDTGDASGSADVASAGTTSSSGPGLILPSCPVAQCNPSPPQNRCDITTSCIQTQPNRQFHCACRAGYKANFPAANGDTSIQYRSFFAGQEYRVFVKAGIKCDRLCDQWWLGPDSCKEVRQISGCN